MKTTLVLSLFACLLFFLSCSENSDNAESMKQVTSSSKLDTVIFAIDTLQYSFGNFGSKDELSVVKQPSHAKLFNLSVLQNADRVLHYAPQDAYLGIDSVVVLSKRISNETDPVVKIDSVLLVIRTVKNDIHKNIIGKWVLTMMCGGFTGRCDSIDPANTTKQIEFGYNMDFTESNSGSVLKKLNYYIKDSLCVYGTVSVIKHFIFVNGSFEGNKFKRKFEYDNNDNLEELNGDMCYIYSHLKE